MKGEKVTETRKQKLAATIKNLPESLRKGYERISVKDYSDEDFDTLISDITTEVSTVESEMKAKGYVFGQPQTGTSTSTSTSSTSKGQASEQEVKDAVARINV